ncbi:MAG TPA: chemotaxis protein CheB, partial [Polyangia bacterium]|nr:chemotaxis protein CheB [Polyangia bacterium]
MIRVLIVDDSAFARKVLRQTLAGEADIEVVDIARDGLEALEKIQDLKPDVVTLDLVMPNLDGIGVLKALPPAGAPRVVIVSISDAASELGVHALELGAVALVHKPTALATERLYDLSAELVAAVRSAVVARAPAPLPPLPSPSIIEPEWAPAKTSADLIVIGASTGGPQALTRLVGALPKDFPVPVALVLHIPPEYTAPFAARLDGGSALEVREAEDGMALTAGRVVVARGGVHLTVVDDGGVLRAKLALTPAGTAHRPAVDVLFASAARATGARTLGVVLTGMGD